MQSYPSNINCAWRIQLQNATKAISLAFNSNFDIQDSPSCSSSYVEVRDGDGPNSMLVGRYCGSIAPSAITSSTNTLYIRSTHHLTRCPSLHISLTTARNPLNPVTFMLYTTVIKISLTCTIVFSASLAEQIVVSLVFVAPKPLKISIFPWLQFCKSVYITLNCMFLNVSILAILYSQL